MTSLKQNEAGVSLIETMIASLAAAIMLSAAIDSLQHLQSQFLSQQSAVDRVQDGRIGLQIIQDEIHLARPGFASAGDAAVISAGPQHFEFWANLDGLTAQLTQPTTAGDTVLAVTSGTGWRKGKRVVICAADACADGKLAKDGRLAGLTLTAPIGKALDAGSMAAVTERVRYYMGKDGEGIPTLMRQVDGGGNPLVGNIEALEFRYMDRMGRPTMEPAEIAFVHIDIAIGRRGRRVSADIALNSD
jgi:hypothetical protein